MLLELVNNIQTTIEYWRKLFNFMITITQIRNQINNQYTEIFFFKSFNLNDIKKILQKINRKTVVGTDKILLKLEKLVSGFLAPYLLSATNISTRQSSSPENAKIASVALSGKDKRKKKRYFKFSTGKYFKYIFKNLRINLE